MSSETSRRSASSADLAQLLEDSGAVLKGHFILTSGRHSDTYFEKFRVLERPDVLSALCAEIASAFRGRGVELVAGPTTGGIIIAFEVARQLGVPALYVESEGGKKTLRRGAQVQPGSRTLIVDDVLTTGRSLAEVSEVLAGAGGVTVGAAVLIDRSEGETDYKGPIFSAYRVQAQSFAPDEVPEWLSATEASKPGTRQAL